MVGIHRAGNGGHVTNEQRREALARARTKALEWAEKAEAAATYDHATDYMSMASMWAEVAQALKVGAGHDTDGVLWSHERGRG